MTLDDASACREMGLHLQRPPEWKKDPEFLARYEHLNEDGLELAKDLTRALLGKAAGVLEDELEATRETASGGLVPDWQARHRAVDLLMTVQGLKLTRVEQSGPGGGPVQVNLSGLTDDEILSLRSLATRAAEPAKPH